MSEQSAFDPTRYLTKISGRDYLEVKWRLVWLRSTHPEAQIETALVEHRDDAAIFRARVILPGGASATGWGSERAGDFADYLEKAETKALGRALAAVGFGTQFCWDFDFGVEQQRVVDSPVDIRAARDGDPSTNGARLAATDRQLHYLQTIARQAGITSDGLEERAQQSFGQVVAELSRRDISQLIEILQAERAAS
ncbi:MAG TPA: hypothetical protein PK593_06570 [Thermomicrobiales bacterium]|nr:hypothetical protein [Thermomicrobiales bacterium]HQZ88762.1 hypothetical protein [Thermomicrobiales bacterium]HRA30975.1 hypothetical protein [Thermomicrobiales bacterium]